GFMHCLCRKAGTTQGEHAARHVWKFGREGYSALIKSSDGMTTWGFDVSKKHGNAFTMELANELIDRASEIYKSACPDGYNKEAYNPSAIFTKIECDMSNYCMSESYDGVTIAKRIGKKKIGTYDKEKNLLRIWEDDIPIYQNNNGIICRDSVALADSLL
ncbi:MAG: hypothetical protein K2G55_15970, partial [Lachnospiraceae bacterium]|nr:hypothetical protein [Lachnospiraceae bacterium]MDE7204048.1 hypothetical protein [Lachnospiraceae bacterium]